AFFVRVKSQYCVGVPQYDQCSSNSMCACFYEVGANGTALCVNRFVTCSELVACYSSNNLCFKPNHRCLHHPRCNNHPVCYPVPSFNKQLCPIMTIIPDIPANASWSQNGFTIAGGNGLGSATNQLFWPRGLYLNYDETIVIADSTNHRIIQWTKGDTNGQVVAGGNGRGSQLNQLQFPMDVLIDKETDSLIICDSENRRVVQWSRHSGTTLGEILINNTRCYGLAMDEQRNLYVVDEDEHEVRRYRIGDRFGTDIAGGHGEGDLLYQLNNPYYIFVDRQQTLYVSDTHNHRVMKWSKGATEGVIAAGGQGSGSALSQLYLPGGVFVDTLGTLYVADSGNHRVVRWPT
ncbi:unnamed protein product, partial [Rotaria sp. Silwood2]